MSNGDDACTTNLEATDMVGLALMSEAAFLSMISEVLVLSLILWRAIRHWRRPTSSSVPRWKLIQSPLDLYVLSLIIGGLFRAVGCAITIRWIAEQRVYCSALCTVQGAVENIGATVEAMSMMAIAVHTFLKIAFRLKLRYNWVPKLVVGVIWLYNILFVGIGAGIHHVSTKDGKGNFLSPTPYWCWIGSGFQGERLAGEYFWLWVGGFASILLYVPLYFITSGGRFKSGGGGGVPSRILLYPIVFTIIVLPRSILRWAPIRSEKSAAIFITITLYQLSGFINVLLLFYTRGGINLLSDTYNDDNVDEEIKMGLGGLDSDADSLRRRSKHLVVAPIDVDGAGLPD